MTFTDDEFLGGEFDSALANGLGIQGFTYDLTGSTLTISGNIGNPGGTDALSFTPAAVAATPEPTSIVLLGTGLLGVMSAMRKRFA